ncbi:hypothetical protein CAEBREN_01350 [Caenorhabditis brenneri]|uniref:BCAS3 WD40 domain-containing protein n=1 Tax=Caenorhabditis brenneri TaxID=135651 RepID=G0NS59_CAEBE|nr:hypothetical protein CAEBREN_01350 [Caenorhabditis brenneri]
MPPNAHSGGHSKRKNKNKSSNGGGPRPQLQQNPQPQPEPQSQPEGEKVEPKPEEKEKKEEIIEEEQDVQVEKEQEKEEVVEEKKLEVDQEKEPKEEVEEPKKEELEEEQKEEKSEEPVAPTAAQDKTIDANLLDFSSSDRSSLSSRPNVQDSPEDDEDDVPVVTRITAPPPPHQEPPLDEMLVDMSLDDPAPPPRRSHQRSAPPPIPPMNTIISKSRANSVTYIKGQVVRQSAVEQQTLANQVVDLVAMGMSKSQPQGTQVTAEKAEWVQLSSVEKAGEPNERLEVLVVGLCRGYQIWTMSQSSEFEEVLSERQGPVRAVKVLPNNLKLRGKEDPFADVRPLIAVVDASSHHPDRQYCSVTVISLLTGKEVHKIKFEEPVCAINVSDQFLVVSLSNMAYAYSILTFNEVRSIRTAPSCDNCPPALSLSCQLLAFAATSLDASLQSSGGLAAEVEAKNTDNYTDHLYNAMSYFSRGVKSISESVGGGSGGSTKTNQPQGIISVVNLTASKEEETEGVMCHYVAHVDPISYISFSPDQRLVLSADANANVFNIFLLMPHATTSSLAAVQHLYKLNRGSTPAKVVSTAFSEDCRWLAITTNHATTHVFAVCPFGGKPNQRTHGDTFVNKESRFHRSAGLTDAADVTALIGPSKHRAMADSCSYIKEHPIAVTCPTLAKTNGNSRVGPFPPPLLLFATEKIKDSRYTKEDLTAWAVDMTNFSYSGTPSSSSPAIAARKRLEVSRMSVMFRMKSYNSTTSTKLAKTTKMLMSMSLMVAKVDPTQGVVVMQHEIKSLKREGEVNMDAPPQISINPVGGWVLQRTKNNADMHAPMPCQSPLMLYATVETGFTKRTGDEDVWTPHVETRSYLPPHRWIWQGPQFELFEYREDDQPSLMSPGSKDKGSTASFKSIPVLVGSEAMNITKKSIPADATRIECGSYTSANSYNTDSLEQTLIGGYCSTINGDKIAFLADAVRDISSDEETKKARSQRSDDNDEFFDTESSAPFVGRTNGSNGTPNGAANGKLKKKKTPPASAPPPTSAISSKSSSSSQQKSATSNGRERSKDSDDFGTFDMEDI